MTEAREKIISDEEINRVHANANFGSMSPREVVDEGVRKYAVGYQGGSTMVAILREHGLITKPQGISYKASLTDKGKRYARELYSHFETPDRAAYERGRRDMAREAHDKLASMWASTTQEHMDAILALTPDAQEE